MKRFALVLIVLVSVVSVTACGDGEKAAPPGKPLTGADDVTPSATGERQPVEKRATTSALSPTQEAGRETPPTTIEFAGSAKADTAKVEEKSVGKTGTELIRFGNISVSLANVERDENAARLTIVVTGLAETETTAEGQGKTSLLGKYASEARSTDYLELKADGTYYQEEGGTGYSGQWKVDGDEIILTLPNGVASKGKIDGDTLVDRKGVRWSKHVANKQPAGLAITLKDDLGNSYRGELPFDPGFLEIYQVLPAGLALVAGTTGVGMPKMAPIVEVTVSGTEPKTDPSTTRFSDIKFTELRYQRATGEAILSFGDTVQVGLLTFEVGAGLIPTRQEPVTPYGVSLAMKARNTDYNPREGSVVVYRVSPSGPPRRTTLEYGPSGYGQFNVAGGGDGSINAALAYVGIDRKLPDMVAALIVFKDISSGETTVRLFPINVADWELPPIFVGEGGTDAPTGDIVSAWNKDLGDPTGLVQEKPGGPNVRDLAFQKFDNGAIVLIEGIPAQAVPADVFQDFLNKGSTTYGFIWDGAISAWEGRHPVNEYVSNVDRGTLGIRAAKHVITLTVVSLDFWGDTVRVNTRIVMTGNPKAFYKRRFLGLKDEYSLADNLGTSYELLSVWGAYANENTIIPGSYRGSVVFQGQWPGDAEQFEFSWGKVVENSIVVPLRVSFSFPNGPSEGLAVLDPLLPIGSYSLPATASQLGERNGYRGEVELVTAEVRANGIRIHLNLSVHESQYRFEESWCTGGVLGYLTHLVDQSGFHYSAVGCGGELKGNISRSEGQTYKGFIAFRFRPRTDAHRLTFNSWFSEPIEFTLSQPSASQPTPRSATARESVPVTFRWDPVPGADRYVFAIFPPDRPPTLMEIEADAQSNEKTIRLNPGSGYSWFVFAKPGGEPEYQYFTVTPGMAPLHYPLGSTTASSSAGPDPARKLILMAGLCSSTDKIREEGHWMTALKADLRNKWGYQEDDIVEFSYSPNGWNVGYNVEDTLKGVGNAATNLGQIYRAFPDAQFDIIAHSLGGVVALDAMNRFPPLREQTRRIITVDSPLRGISEFQEWVKAPLAQLRCGELGWTSPEHPTWQDLDDDSPVIQAIRNDPWADFTVISFANDQDQVVASDRSFLPRKGISWCLSADSSPLPGSNHTVLLENLEHRADLLAKALADPLLPQRCNQ